MNTPTNCCNCGAVMEYSKQYYGSMYKCPYCGTEHHIDKLGRIEEYKVTFMWQGHLIEAYLNSIDFEQDYIDTTMIDSRGTYIRDIGAPRMTFTFTGYPRL